MSRSVSICRSKALAFALAGRLSASVNHDALPRPNGRRAWMPAVFRPSHGWRVGKSPQHVSWYVSFVGEGHFLWFVSFWPEKEMNSPKAKRFSTAKLVKPLPFNSEAGQTFSFGIKNRRKAGFPPSRE
jgi:hypothetical protein